MKFVAVLCAVLVLAAAAQAASPVKAISPIAKKAITPAQTPNGLDLCPFCVSFTSQSINQLLNMILNAGVIGGCGDLCSYLPNQLEQTACSLICDVVGVELFIKLIEKADLDPIYFCELVKFCPVVDCPGNCVSIDKVVVDPPSGPQGTTFNIEMMFTVHNATGTGEIVININPPDADPFGDGQLDEGFQPGSYSIKFQLKAEPSEDEPFDAGDYGVQLAICEGQCGSAHPHSKVYDVANSKFTITQ